MCTAGLCRTIRKDVTAKARFFRQRNEGVSPVDIRDNHGAQAKSLRQELLVSWRNIKEVKVARSE